MKIFISTLIAGLLLFTSCKAYKNVQDPEYRDIRDVRLIKASLLETTAGIDVAFYNPNNFGLQVTSTSGDVYLDNSFFGRFNLDSNVPVKKNSEFILPVIFKLDNISLIKNQQDIFKKKEALLRIEGIVHVSKAGFSREIPVKFERVESIEKFKALLGK